MTVPSFLNISPASNCPDAVIALNGELVRGSEAQVIDKLLPRVKQGSLALDLSGVERIDAAGIAALITSIARLWKRRRRFTSSIHPHMCWSYCASSGWSQSW